MNDPKVVYAVIVNSTDSRGSPITVVKQVCEMKVTADRTLRELGSDGVVASFTATWQDGFYWAPCTLVPPTSRDVLDQDHLTRLQAAERKAEQAGLTREEIDALKGVFPVQPPR